MKRNPAIELYRCLLMFGICLLHATWDCGHNNPRIASLLFPCVNGFVFISGWFGINYSFKRLMKLSLNAVYAGAAAVLTVWLIRPELLTMDVECWRTIRYMVIGQWFFLAYATLMLLAPAINYIVDHLDSTTIKTIMIPLAVLMALNAASDLPGLLHLRYPAGFGSYTPLSLACTYTVARLVRKYNLFDLLKTSYVAIGIVSIAILFIAFPASRLSCYASPLSVIFAGLLFYAFSKIPLTHGGGIINLIAPSMFTVYLFHSHPLGFAVLSHIEDVLISHDCTLSICRIATAAVAFSAGLIADIPRRILMPIINPKQPTQK